VNTTPGQGDDQDDGSGDLEAAVRERGRIDALNQLDRYNGDDAARHRAAVHMLLVATDQLLPSHPIRIMAAYYGGWRDGVAEVIGPVPPGPDDRGEGDG